MRRPGNRGFIGILLAIVVVLMLIGLAAVCTPGEDDHSMGPTISRHERDCDPGWEACDGGDYGGYHGDQGGGGNGNKGRDGDDQHGDDNCHSFCGNTIIVPSPPGMGGRR